MVILSCPSRYEFLLVSSPLYDRFVPDGNIKLKKLPIRVIRVKEFLLFRIVFNFILAIFVYIFMEK